MKKYALILMAALLILVCCNTGAWAVEYSFSAPNHDDFYRATPYEEMYGSEYNYGGPNIIDFTDTTALLPGIITPTVPKASPAAETVRPASADADYYPNYPSAESSFSTTITAVTTVSELERSDGSIGTLSIPSLDINMKVYEGATNQSMNKGLGHFSDTSGWYGNIGICGHNRGSKYAIGSIKNLEIGDIIKYSTVLGTREYAVTFVGTIYNSDWTYLADTADNRITLVTCLSDQPSLRVCVQGKEIK